MPLLHDVYIRERDDFEELAGVTIKGLAWEDVTCLIESISPAYNDLVFTIYTQRKGGNTEHFNEG